MNNHHSPSVPVRFSGELPYWVGGIALAAANTAILLLHGKPWGITSMLTNASSRLLQWLSLRPEQWSYYLSPSREQALGQFGLSDQALWLNLGIVVGVVISAWLADEFRLHRPRSWRGIALSALGGVLMGYGARLALGCNAGALLGGVPSWSLHGWVFLLVTFFGVVAGLRLFRSVL